MLFRVVLLLAIAASVMSKGTVTFSSSDVASGIFALGGVKATYDTEVDVHGSKLKLSALYDKDANAKMLKEAKVSGSAKDVDYTLTYGFKKRLAALTLATRKAGVLFKINGDSSEALTSVSAKKSVDVGDRTLLAFEPAFNVKKSLATLKVTGDVDLGSGASLSASASATPAGDLSGECALGYETSISDGRTLTASVVPMGKEAALEVKDSTTDPTATWIGSASMALGGRPKVTMRRVQKF